LNPGPVDPLPKTGPIVPPTVLAAPDGAGSASSDAELAEEQDMPGIVDPRLFMAGPGDPQKPGEPAVPPPSRPPHIPEYQPPDQPMEEPFAPAPPPPQAPPPEPIAPPPQA